MDHILVVDDDPALCWMIQEALADEQYTVETANNGVEALERVRQNRPAVLLLDLAMPVMNGWQFLEACRAEQVCEGVSIVLMSAGHRAGEAEALNAQGFLAKPFDLDDLAAAIERLKRDSRGHLS